MMVMVGKEAGGLYRGPPHTYIVVDWSQLRLIANDDNEECSNRELKQRDPQQPTGGQVEGGHGEEIG